MTGTTDDRTLPTYAADAFDVPFVIGGMDEPLGRDTRWGDHAHPTHELLWNERGASTVTVGSRTWTVTTTNGVWIPAGMVHRAFARAGIWYRTTHFRPRSVPSLADEPVAVEVTPLLRLLLERLAVATLDDASRATTEAMVQDVLEPAPAALLVHVPTHPLLGPVVDAVLADPADRRTLVQWARSLGVSPRTVTRAFRAETGLGFAAWTASVRAQHAVGLLAAGQDPEAVAAAAGYGSVSAFGAAFRRVTGTTPGAFRPA